MPGASDERGPSPVRLWPLYAGGFLGPFGSTMVSPMLPEIAGGFDTSVGVAARALTAYLVPFALLMVVSGTLAERWGRRRTIQGAYVGYALSSLLCALAPSVEVLLVGRVLQGASNAFTTPVLLAVISELVPARRLGAAMGRYGSLQAAGQSFAPLVGGMAAALQWRWAFGASIVAALVLASLPPPDPTAPTRAGAPAGRVRALANRRLGVACSVAFLVQSTALGTSLLVALLASDRYGLGPNARGLVVAAFGAAGLAVGARLGRLSDQLGLRPFGVAAALVLAAAVAGAGLSPALGGVVAAVAVAGAAATATRVVVTSLALTSTPSNRGGATSVALAWQFLGGALAPVLWLPVYDRSATGGFVAASTGAVAAAAVLVLARRSGGSAPAPVG